MAEGAESDLFEELAARRQAGERVVLATVVAAHGSTPRAAGARLLLRSDGSMCGSVGGGVREAEVLEVARDLIRRGGCRLLQLEYHEDGGGDGPVCGGTMTVFVEAIDPPQRVVIAGAGHVGHSLHQFLRLLGIHTVVIDPRPEFASPERFPGARLRVVPFEEALAGVALTPRDGVVIVTQGHRHDEVVLRQALASQAGYIGMIGSSRKVAEVFEHLRRDGFSEGELGRVHAPVGLPIGAETPAEIALAIAAQIVSTFRAKRGS